MNSASKKQRVAWKCEQGPAHHSCAAEDPPQPDMQRFVLQISQWLTSGRQFLRLSEDAVDYFTVLRPEVARKCLSREAVQKLLSWFPCLAVLVTALADWALNAGFPTLRRVESLTRDIDLNHGYKRSIIGELMQNTNRQDPSRQDTQRWVDAEISVVPPKPLIHECWA